MWSLTRQLIWQCRSAGRLHRLNTLACEHFRLCSTSENKNNGILSPEAINYPTGDVNIQKYLENCVSEYQRLANNYETIDRKIVERNSLLRPLVKSFENRSKIVADLNALDDEAANEKDDEMRALVEEEKMVGFQHLIRVLDHRLTTFPFRLSSRTCLILIAI